MASIDRNVQRSLSDFSRDIICKDMGSSVLEEQRRMFGRCLKNKLPVDTVSHPNKCIFFSQLIHTQGDIGKYIFDECQSMFSADVQDQPIFASSAASGVGKTHGAYAAGKYLYSLIIRVGKQSKDAIDGRDELSAPWECLIQTIRTIVAYYQEQFGVENVEDLHLSNRKQCAHDAYLCIKLLIGCYVGVSIEALSLTETSELTTMDKREFLLRFHRNGVSEDLVRDRFVAELNRRREKEVEGCYRSMRDSVDNFFDNELKDCDVLRGQDLLICFDEINALKGLFPDLFIHKDVYENDKETMPDLLQEDEGMHRGLLYVVACCMLSLSHSTKWAMLMTGTAFSLTQFCLFRKKFDVPDMHALLNHYFKISDGALGHEEVVRMLDHCRGRPHIFVNIVFKPIFDALLKSELKAEVLDVDLLLGTWSTASQKMRTTYQRIFRLLLKLAPRILPHGANGSTKSLVPLLLSALLFNNCVLKLPNDHVVAEAIRSSIVPVTSSEGDICVDLTGEPIVEDALWNVVLDLAERYMENVMRLLLSGIKCECKGITAETAFSYFLALRSALSVRKQEPILLSALLLPFFEDPSQQPLQLSSYKCEVKAVVDMSEWDSSKCFLWKFVKSDGTYDTSIILKNIPKNAGVDVAFLVINGNAELDSPLRIRLVVLQLKNRKSGQLSKALLNLHPGTQYMTNEQRIYAIKYCRLGNGSQLDAADDPVKRFPKSSSGGIDFMAWKDYHETFATAHPLLCDKWIRIAVFGQPIHSTVLSFFYDFPRSICTLHSRTTGTETEDRSEANEYDSEHDDVNEAFGPEEERLRNAADDSPIVVLTMNSKRWLTDDFRNDFIDNTQTELSMPRLKDPVSCFDSLKVSWTSCAATID